MLYRIFYVGGRGYYVTYPISRTVLDEMSRAPASVADIVERDLLVQSVESLVSDRWNRELAGCIYTLQGGQ